MSASPMLLRDYEAADQFMAMVEDVESGDQVTFTDDLGAFVAGRVSPKAVHGASDQCLFSKCILERSMFGRALATHAAKWRCAGCTKWGCKFELVFGWHIVSLSLRLAPAHRGAAFASHPSLKGTFSLCICTYRSVFVIINLFKINYAIFLPKRH